MAGEILLLSQTKYQAHQEAGELIHPTKEVEVGATTTTRDSTHLQDLHLETMKMEGEAEEEVAEITEEALEAAVVLVGLRLASSANKKAISLANVQIKVEMILEEELAEVVAQEATEAASSVAKMVTWQENAPTKQSQETLEVEEVEVAVAATDMVVEAQLASSVIRKATWQESALISRRMERGPTRDKGEMMAAPIVDSRRITMTSGKLHLQQLVVVVVTIMMLGMQLQSQAQVEVGVTILLVSSSSPLQFGEPLRQIPLTLTTTMMDGATILLVALLVGES
jgi:hypothetical protein